MIQSAVHLLVSNLAWTGVFFPTSPHGIPLTNHMMSFLPIICILASVLYVFFGVLFLKRNNNEVKNEVKHLEMGMSSKKCGSRIQGRI